MFDRFNCAYIYVGAKLGLETSNVNTNCSALNVFDCEL